MWLGHKDSLAANAQSCDNNATWRMGEYPWSNYSSSIVHLSILSPTTYLPGQGGNLKVKFPTHAGARRVFKFPPGKVGYFAVEANLFYELSKAPLVRRFFGLHPPGRG